MSDTQTLGLDEAKDGRVEEIKFEPIKGYPMLHWRGKLPFTSTQYYPAQIRERHGEPVDGWMNKIYWGDNLQVMSHLLKDYRGRIQVIYLDPPFDSKADYKTRVSLKGATLEGDYSSFEEKQYSDIWANDDFLQFVYERVVLCKELLSDTGSFFLHCDWHKSHHLRCIVDEVFGQNHFVNEIIWLAEGGGASGNKFSRKHQTVFFYTKASKEKDRVFNADAVRVPYKTENIRPQTYNYEANAKKRPGFKDGYTWVPNEDGKIPPDVWLDCFLAESEGIPLDVWPDVKGLYGPSGEILGYPTQKPESLLERIIKASSKPGDLILDAFMGSGTTQAVAMKLGRRFLGADINLGAVHLTTKRLINLVKKLSSQTAQTQIIANEEGEKLPRIYSSFEVYNVNHYDVFRNPIEARELLLETLEVNKLPQGQLFDGEKDSRMVKIMPVNRIATRADLNELITGFDIRGFEKRQAENPTKPVERVTLVCMGHEPDLAAQLKREMQPYLLDVEVVDILRDKKDLTFKRDSEAEIAVANGSLSIERFYPMNLLQKLSLETQNVEDWRELVESVMIDWNYAGGALEPKTVDIPEKNEMVKGVYRVPDDAGTIRVKITDVLSESLEVTVQHG